MGQTLANHSYVDIRLVGNEFIGTGYTVQCHTDLSTCCSGAQGDNRGDWYFPNGARLPFPGGGDITESRQAQRVNLRRTSSTEPTGIYRCDIETIDVYNSNMRETVFVGLYAEGGMKCSQLIMIIAEPLALYEQLHSCYACSLVSVNILAITVGF